jgi:lambda repressor-like predicted transcriptional regulator
LENEHLRAAITRAGLSLEEFADIVQVDVRTVRRWLAGRTPYPRHRTAVANALETTEHVLWPDAVAPPAEPPKPGRPTPPVVTDVIAGYPRASDTAAPDVLDLLRSATSRIELTIPNFADERALPRLLGVAAATGCRVRVIVEIPDQQIEPVLGIDTIEVRASFTTEGHILCRADEEMILVPTSIHSISGPPPMIHLRRAVDGGMFDRLADDFDANWLQATPLTSSEQLDAYLADAELEVSADPEQADPLPARSPEAPNGSPGDAPRRWPRRRT